MGRLLALEGVRDEEYLTQRFCLSVIPEMRYAKFNKKQEGRVGLSLVVGGPLRGMLRLPVQAKNIKRDGRR
ncbi:hypothetical protein [Streptomyces sp. NPDC056431]|uniref:hypothetical protein n=1 Tax=Streptomyces sp. NPDC056431 TaxID=3345814 RepID=UPI0036BB37CA